MRLRILFKSGKLIEYDYDGEMDFTQISNLQPMTLNDEKNGNQVWINLAEVNCMESVK